jgi:tRNA A37 threonylcarbamoyladenosine dehydratase
MSKNLSRLQGAVDLAVMQNSRILGVGTGGACGLYEDLARSGIGKLTVIDFDTVDETNLTTQGYDESQIGMLTFSTSTKRT